ncbi:YbaB/EbfC family nucleoid-associated protein [Nocardia sp. NPDC127526]|uniref:YbaB/EbfC family nucleoid-associated protein n=1 Tax=Nocardia sp. NPDC127526 TaxID=3345393 RepID=UPI00362A70CF
MNNAMNELVRELHERLARIQELNAAIAAMRVRESSPDGVVTVEVDGNGALLDLELTRGVTELSAGELAAGIVATADSAVRKVFAERADAVNAFNAGAAALPASAPDDQARAKKEMPR